MKNVVSVVAAFFVMLCFGSIYNWSIFVPELKTVYGLSTFQTQLIFGTVIAVYPFTMIFVGRLHIRLSSRFLVLCSGFLFLAGNLLAWQSAGNFYLLWLGIGLLGGIATGIGYMVSLAVPVRWFPNKKGLVTGIVTAGFGGGAILMAVFTSWLLQNGYSVLTIFLVCGLLLGAVIFLSAFFIFDPVTSFSSSIQDYNFSWKEARFIFLAVGIFCGTFCGLMVIGNLKPIGLSHGIDSTVLSYSIALLSFANLVGRLFWGWLSDIVSAKKLIIVALFIAGISTFIISSFDLGTPLFLAITVVVGFSFGANFVLFAKETMHLYGDKNYSRIYPIIYQGYGVAGIVGPALGGILFDITGSYLYPGIVALVLCFIIVGVYKNAKIK